VDHALLAGFESLPQPAPGELDLDGALKRHPEVVLVDDLAHANPPGARHPKRWKDADELLAAGIDVFTTMSVQHLESLNDVVGEITGIRESETVPDTFFDTADETIMVDMSADELLVRLREGRVHIGDLEKGVARTYFSKGSLLALREIALRRTADVVEDEVQKYRIAKSIDAVWKTRDHLLCCIGPYAGAEHVVRSAARLAHHLDATPDRALAFAAFEAERLPNTTLFSVPGMKAETAVIAFDLEGIAVSSGSACSSGKVAPSHVLAAMEVAPELARGAIRVSLGYATTSDDVGIVLKAWEKLAEGLYKAGNHQEIAA